MFEGTQERAEKDRGRLAYLLLDVFLGGFAVAVVLLVALARPASTTVRSGSGGEEFLVIDFFWPDSELITYAPVLRRNGNSVASAGLASLWDGSDPLGPWPEYALSTGALSGTALLTKPYKLLTVDGFDPRPGEMALRQLGSPDQRNGQIWMSMPCAGVWEIGLRVVSTASETTDVPQVTMQLRSSGYTGIWPTSSVDVVEFGVQDTTRTAVGEDSVLATLSKTGDGHEYLHQINLEAKREMEHCSP